MTLTDKQKNILLKDGFAEDAINRMSYEDASAEIGHILARPRPAKLEATKTNAGTFVHPAGTKMFPQKDANPFYVAYAKDLAIAMIEAQIAQKKDINATEIMDLAIMMVGAARQRLKE